MSARPAIESLLAVAFLAATSAYAITIDTVPVGNPGNAADNTGYGDVEYTYNIGTYEVTNTQYVEFLNAVAATDPHGLYNIHMWSCNHGCKIERSGSSGSFTYSVAADRANRPVNYLSWYDAARFTNWLTTGDTESGVYEFTNGTITGILDHEMAAATLGTTAWFIPSEDEWYKAAYHKNDGATGNYWDYPTGTNSTPSNDLINPDPGNNAIFYQNGHTITGPYYMTEVGEFENSESSYETFDQGGNLLEWNETAVTDSSRGLRGGYWYANCNRLHASSRNDGQPSFEGSIIGFRVASIPEPGCITLLVCGLLAGLLWRRRGRGRCLACAAAVATLLIAGSGSARADVFNMGGTRNADGSWAGLASLETVPVSNPGNAGELSGAGAGGYGPDAIVGAVDYAYNIGTYEVTSAQYVEFLNAVAAADPYGLYNANMWSSQHGCKIQRSNSWGSYTYSVAADRANRPVAYVSWYDAARFCNWLTTGDTELGVYTFAGISSIANILDHETAAQTLGKTAWFIPTEDEWYKAAYHKNDGVTGNYWDFPTGTNNTPSNDLINPDPGNHANYLDENDWSHTIGGPYYTTEVGEFENSGSPYGTFDQGGNLLEWNETLFSGSSRSLRGGHWDHPPVVLEASHRYGSREPSYEVGGIGFRVASIPERVIGDLNADGIVGSHDLDLVRGWWLMEVEPGRLDRGDATGDGVVNSADLDLIRSNWGSGLAAVPEPSTILFVFLGAVFVAFRRRR